MIIEIVTGDNLVELLENALWEKGYGELEITDYELSGKGKTIIQGSGTTVGIESNEPKMWGYTQEFSFEVNLGEHKDDLVIFDEFEVCIQFD